MTSPDATPLVAALSRLAPDRLRAFIAGPMGVAHQDGVDDANRRVWHAFGALAADVQAAQRQQLEELEFAFDDFEVGEIVSEDTDRGEV